MGWIGDDDWRAAVEEQRLLGELFDLVVRHSHLRQREIDLALGVDPDTPDDAT